MTELTELTAIKMLHEGIVRIKKERSYLGHSPLFREILTDAERELNSDPLYLDSLEKLGLQPDLSSGTLLTEDELVARLAEYNACYAKYIKDLVLFRRKGRLAEYVSQLDVIIRDGIRPITVEEKQTYDEFKQMYDAITEPTQPDDIWGRIKTHEQYLYEFKRYASNLEFHFKLIKNHLSKMRGLPSDPFFIRGRKHWDPLRMSPFLPKRCASVLIRS